MATQQICPNCRSTFEINGALDFGAKSLQTVNCPVCSQDIWVPSGLWPQRWTVGKIINRVTPVTPPTLVAPPSDDDPVWSEFVIPGQDQAQALGRGLYNIGIWIVVVLILVLLIKWSFK